MVMSTQLLNDKFLMSAKHSGVTTLNGALLT